MRKSKRERERERETRQRHACRPPRTHLPHRSWSLLNTGSIGCGHLLWTAASLGSCLVKDKSCDWSLWGRRESRALGARFSQKWSRSSVDSVTSHSRSWAVGASVGWCLGSCPAERGTFAGRCGDDSCTLAAGNSQGRGFEDMVRTLKLDLKCRILALAGGVAW